jgi:hypothetical protein
MPHVYIIFEYLYYLVVHEFDVILSYAPWELIVSFLNSLWNSTPASSKETAPANHPLAEDYTLRAMTWSWSWPVIDRPWSFEPLDTDPPGAVESTYTKDLRISRILSIGALIAAVSNHASCCLYWLIRDRNRIGWGIRRLLVLPLRLVKKVRSL